MKRSVEQKIFAEQFRSLADTFAAHADDHRIGRLPRDSAARIGTIHARTLAGNAIIGAFRRGFLPPLPGLKERIEWHSAPTPDLPEGGGAILVRCPANLFTDVVGGHLLPVRKQGDGLWESIGERYGGIVPEMYPELLTPFPYHAASSGAAEGPQSYLREDRTDELRREAAACRILAALTEGGGDKNGGQRSDKPTDNQLVAVVKILKARPGATHKTIIQELKSAGGRAMSSATLTVALDIIREQYPEITTPPKRVRRKKVSTRNTRGTN